MNNLPNPAFYLKSILDSIQSISERYRIVSLTRHIVTCKDLLDKDPLIDIAIWVNSKPAKVLLSIALLINLFYPSAPSL